jgi:endo-1,3(4)-beta-glucanase
MMRFTGCLRSTAAVLVLLAAACTPDHRTGEVAKTSITMPKPGGKGSVADGLPPDSVPAKKPAQAGTELAGQALPTNQWWTSALTGPRSEPMWAHPLAMRAAENGLQLSSARPTASANAIVTPFTPAVTVGGPITELRVTGHGAFHVAVRAKLAGGGTVDATLVQGSPVLYLRFQDTAPALTAPGAEPGETSRLTVAGQRWDLLSDGGGWRRDGDRFVADGARDGRVAVARVPDGADDRAWRDAVNGAAGDPVVDTTATMAYDRTGGVVTQTLTARRHSGGPGVWALLPHQRGAATPKLAGGYPDALGTLTVVRARTIEVRLPMPGLLTGAPKVPLSGAARAEVVADLDRDLAIRPTATGSYFGLKELGRLATIAEVARGVGAEAQRRQALDRLRPQLEDWLTYGGRDDPRYFAYDKTWGGLIAVPAEFGSQHYNDHHFQYGYLVRAAAVLAEADGGFRRDYGDTVDLVAREYLGGGRGFPKFRVFNPYLGHSAASGFAAFADGNNQESSSEAVAAWEAIVRWGLVRGRAELVDSGATHYALEAATARMYWLGQGLDRPPGYAHRTAGIVWDAKIDYATFFDPKPESVQGIQLLPLTFGSLYRADARAVAARAADLPGTPRVWGDLFAADLAAADPAAARARLGPDLPREDSTSRGMVRLYVEMLATFGPPQPEVTADGPFGMAFGRADRPTLVAVNPTAERRTVTFRSGTKVVAKLEVAPGETVTRP